MDNTNAENNINSENSIKQPENHHKVQKNFWERESLKTRRTPDHPAVRAFALPKIKEILKITKSSDPNSNPSPDSDSNARKTVLDVGCGNGFFTKPFSEFFNVKGVDFSEKMVSLNPIPGCQVQDANNLQESDSSFDIVFCSNLMHHLDDPKKAIREMKRVSKEYVILSEPNRNNPLMFLFSFLKKEERLAMKYSKSYLTKLCKSQDLTIIQSRTMGSIVPNKTSPWMIPILRIFDNTPFLGFYILVVAKKKVE